MEKDILESAKLGEELLEGRRYKVRLIEGDRLGATGYYPAAVLKESGPAIFKKGTPMFMDHQTKEERENKPFGSVLTLAAELAEDAWYEDDGLYGEIEVFDHFIPTIKALKDKIGISIRAKALTKPTVIGGKQVNEVIKFTEALSADFVVRAGAGGKIVSILESDTSEEESEEQEGKEENMEEVLQKLSEIQEALKTEPVAPEIIVDYDKVLEIAEALASSALDEAGRKRVIELHKANNGDITELISAEEAYKSSLSEESGVEGEEEEDVEESASKEIKLPKRWA